jgi:general secretion pathway protein D
MQALRSVIAKLDIRPAEVLVEAIIAEIDESNITSLGIQWGSITREGGVQGNGTGSSITSFPNFGAGVVGIMPSVQIEAVLSLLRNQNGVDILSTPSIMVLDNQKATIEIGQDVPYQTGSYATTGNSNTVTPFTTNNYKPVTLKLDVTPQINLSRSVRLKLNLKNDTLQNPQNPGLTPIINTSKITNSVIINSDDVLVLGGLISNSNNENINKVPILGDVPFIGPLFQQKTTNQQKKNLMVFIKPIIVHSSEDAMTITHTKYNAIRQTQANFREDLAIIGDKPVSTRLPPWKNKRDLPSPFENEKICCQK